MALAPVLSAERPNVSGGIWNTKLFGELEEGNARSPVVIQGKVEIKSHKDNSRLFLYDVDVSKRKSVNNSSTTTAFIPNLVVYISKKTPKTRMTDILRHGYRVTMRHSEDGLFNNASGNLEASLKNIPDILSCLGLVILKLPEDPPVTEEPFIVALVKFETAKLMTIRTLAGLHLKDTLESILNLKNREKIAMEPLTMELVQATIKSLSYYRKVVKRTWIDFELEPDAEINFATFLRMVDHVDIFLLESQLKRFFDAVDIKKQGAVGQSEFENVLMAFDCMGQASDDLIFMDVYDTFKIQQTPTFLEFFSAQEGLDFSGFIESMQLLGVRKESSELLKAFCKGTGCKEQDVTQAFMSVVALKKAWSCVSAVDKELSKRKLPVERGLLAQGRNEERLLRHIADIESVYLANLVAISAFVDDIKQRVRKEKDARRVQSEQFKEQLHHHAARFVAERGQEKRMQLKKEQEERARKRIEEKVMRNQLLLKQTENKLRKQEELAMALKLNEKLRQDQIRSRGWDRLDLSKQELVTIPLEMYATEAAKARLSYAVIVDLSKNVLESLPPSDFLYWMTSVRHLNLSTNRLTTLPDEMKLLTNIEVLEGYNNRLISLPPEIGGISALLRLDLGSNFLTSIPNSIGKCTSLKYLSLHSNKLTYLPTTIGACMRLEYIDVSQNEISFLPDECEFLIALQQLKLSSNRLLSLPPNIGGCVKLEYIDASCNTLSTLPESFGNLCRLEYCDLTKNNINLSVSSLSKLSQLKYFRVSHNIISMVHNDIGGCTSLEKLALDNNRITSLSPELGLLSKLEDLNVSHNQLDRLLVEIGACRTLVKLNISYNKIKGTLVETIALLTLLTELDISHNPIDELPTSIVGLKSLQTFDCSRCNLKSLPETFFSLTSLQRLSLASNHLTRLPIQLSCMSTLKHIDLSENLIEFLPQGIDAFTNIEHLNLSKNQLKALPLEFIRVIETIPSVKVEGNPWTLLPPDWGRRWVGKHTTEGADNGYDMAKVLTFLYNVKVFYQHAEVIWSARGHLYYTQRMTFEEFLAELRQRIPHSWNEGLSEYVKIVFFSAREKGVFPQWHELSETEININQTRRDKDDAKRSFQVLRSSEDHKSRQEQRHQAYDVDLSRRAKRREEQAAEHRAIDEALADEVTKTIRLDVGVKDTAVETRARALSRERRQEDTEEYLRVMRMQRNR